MTNLNRTIEDALALLTAHGVRLHALLTRLTLHADVAEDLMQDLFCKLVASDGFGQADNQLAYAIRMATNLAFDYRRGKRREPRREAAADMPAVGAASPLADLVRREELENLLDAVGRLPRGQRELIVLRYLEQQDYQTIARQLEKSPHQVRALCHKSIVRLRRVLDQETKRSDSRRSLS